MTVINRERWHVNALEVEALAGKGPSHRRTKHPKSTRYYLPSVRVKLEFDSDEQKRRPHRVLTSRKLSSALDEEAEFELIEVDRDSITVLVPPYRVKQLVGMSLPMIKLGRVVAEETWKVIEKLLTERGR